MLRHGTAPDRRGHCAVCAQKEERMQGKWYLRCSRWLLLGLIALVAQQVSCTDGESARPPLIHRAVMQGDLVAVQQATLNAIGQCWIVAYSWRHYEFRSDAFSSRQIDWPAVSPRRLAAPDSPCAASTISSRAAGYSVGASALITVDRLRPLK